MNCVTGKSGLVRDSRMMSGILSTSLFALETCSGTAVIGFSKRGLLNQLLEFHHKVLYTICLDHGIQRPGNTVVVGTRWVLSRNIYNWVHSMIYFITFRFN